MDLIPYAAAAVSVIGVLAIYLSLSEWRPAITLARAIEAHPIVASAAVACAATAAFPFVALAAITFG